MQTNISLETASLHNYSCQTQNKRIFTLPETTPQIESSVPGADIEIDGAFAGNTPSTLTVTPGQHTIAVKKKGYTDWTRTMNVSGTAVHLNADLSDSK